MCNNPCVCLGPGSNLSHCECVNRNLELENSTEYKMAIEFRNHEIAQQADKCYTNTNFTK